ncbi:hypothetical protein BDV11DRAFT_199560 [Aspergillus similis]
MLVSPTDHKPIGDRLFFISWVSSGVLLWVRLCDCGCVPIGTKYAFRWQAKTCSQLSSQTSQINAHTIKVAMLQRLEVYSIATSNILASCF